MEVVSLGLRLCLLETRRPRGLYGRYISLRERDSRPERVSATPSCAPVAVLLGTRPEAIKLGPVVRAMRAVGLTVRVVTTGQHRELAAEVLPLFDVVPDDDLALMRPEQSLDYLLGRGIELIGDYLKRVNPAAVVVQGDTTSTLAAALAAFHHRIPIAHVEAGLRTHNMSLPFPEEMNRRVVSVLAYWHFAPTATAAENLAHEGIVDRVIITGNTVVDALHLILDRAPGLPSDIQHFVASGAYVLATAHRRESWGDGIRQIASAIRIIVERYPTLRAVFVCHPNPQARLPVEEILHDHPRIQLVGALPYPQFLKLLQGAAVVVSDSGGIQEEGPTLGVPVVVTRSVTERPEGVLAGAVWLTGVDTDQIVAAASAILDNPDAAANAAQQGRGLYGDGGAARRIALVLREALPL